VAELLAVPASYAYELARQGKLPTVRLGKYVRVRASALAAWLAGQDTGGLDGMAVDGSLGQIRTVTRAGAATSRRQRRRSSGASCLTGAPATKSSEDS